MLVGAFVVLRPEKTPLSSVAIPGGNAASGHDSVARTIKTQASIRVDASESVKMSMCRPGECVMSISRVRSILAT